MRLSLRLSLCLSLIFGLLCAPLLSSPAMAQAPDGSGTLAAVARQFPAAWRCAHTGASCSTDYIIKAACALHRLDPRYGLNGKRGGSDLSQDVIAWRGQGVQPDVDGGMMQLYDVIRCAGGAANCSPEVAWDFIDNTTQGRWVDPNAPEVLAYGDRKGCSEFAQPNPGNGTGHVEPKPTPTPANYSPQLEAILVELRAVNAAMNDVRTNQAAQEQAIRDMGERVQSIANVTSNLVADGSWLTQMLQQLVGVRQAVERGVRIRW